MRIDAFGHATLFVHGRRGSVLFDPLLHGVHNEGLYDIHPARALDLGKLPPIDLCVVTHRHLDHFDLPSLAALSRAIPIAIPDDPLLDRIVSAMGFSRVHRVPTFGQLRVGTLALTATPAAAGADENGWIIEEDATVVWNMVDTIPDAEGIAAVKERHPEIDLAIVPWQPLQDATFPSGKPIGFPFDFYDALLRNALQTGAREIALGACGFLAIGDAAWTNQLIFPVTRERFVLDAERANPAWRGAIHAIDPGDAIEVEVGRVRRLPQSVDCCKSLAPYAWEPIEFRPHLLGFPLVERAAELGVATAGPAAAAFFEEELPAYVEEHRARFEWHFRWEVRHRFDVVCHDGTETFVLDFSGKTLAVTRGPSPLALARSAITAGALIGLVAGAASWDLVLLSGAYRHHDHTYRVDGAGLARPPAGLLTDPLATVLGGVDSLERRLVADVERMAPAAFAVPEHVPLLLAEDGGAKASE